MRKASLFILAIGFVTILASCKKKDDSSKITSLEFKQGVYEILENEDKNLKKELVATPDGILENNKIQWKVSDESMGYFEGNFFVPSAVGNVNVTATVQDKSATCKITINAVPVESISLEDMKVPLYGGAMLKITTVPEGISLSRMSFSSSDDDVAYVNPDGTVQGKGIGPATITAKVDDKTATCEVEVYKQSVTSVTLSQTSYKFSYIGETIELIATVEPSDASMPNVKWTTSNASVATVNNGVVTCVGGGTAEIKATADGKTAKCAVTMPEFGTVTDCEGNTYKTVKINNKWWMAENMRATTYSQNNSASKDITIKKLTKGQVTSYTPCCINASDKSNWHESSYSGELSDAQIKKLGYLYNWAAAMGYENGKSVKSTPSGNRQGICPDGWHIPSYEEYSALKTFIEQTEGHGTGTAGKHLKTSDGWFKDGSYYKPADDAYGFSALPAGYYHQVWVESSIYDYRLDIVGRNGILWLKDVIAGYPETEADSFYFISIEDEVSRGGYLSVFCKKSECYSVRCVKN